MVSTSSTPSFFTTPVFWRSSAHRNHRNRKSWRPKRKTRPIYTQPVYTGNSVNPKYYPNPAENATSPFTHFPPTNLNSSTTIPNVFASKNSKDNDVKPNSKSKDKTLMAVTIVVPIIALAVIFSLIYYFWRKKLQKSKNIAARKREFAEYEYNPNTNNTHDNDNLKNMKGLESVARSSSEESSGYRGWGQSNYNIKKSAPSPVVRNSLSPEFNYPPLEAPKKSQSQYPDA